MEPEVEGVAPEDVAHVLAAHDDHLPARFLRDAFQPGGAHLARRSDRESIAGDEKRLPAMNALAELRHQVPKRPRLPPLVERVEAFRHAIGRRGDLVGIDRVEFFLFPGDLQIPENERPAANEDGRRVSGNG